MATLTICDFCDKRVELPFTTLFSKSRKRDYDLCQDHLEKALKYLESKKDEKERTGR